MLNFSSRGPREDGGFKPNITAPGLGDLHRPRPGSRAARSPRPATRCRRATRCSTAPRWPRRRPPAPRRCCCPPPRPNGTRRHPGRAAAGALLARPTSIRRRPGVRAGRRPDRHPGRVGAAEDAASTTRDVHRRRAGLHRRSRDFLATPDRGTGVYNRCAPDAGGQRPRRAKTYNGQGHPHQRPGRRDRATTLDWWATTAPSGRPKTVGCRSNKPVTVTVAARRPARARTARSCGSTTRPPPVVDHRVLNTVVVSQRRRGARVRVHGDGLGRAQPTPVVLRHGPARARRRCRSTSAGIATGRRPGSSRSTRTACRWSSTSSAVCYTNFSDPPRCKPHERVPTTNPLPGVWEIEVEARRTSPPLDNPFQLTAPVQGVTVDPAVVDAAERHRRHPDAGDLDRDQPVRTGHGEGSGRPAGQRATPSVRRSPTTSVAGSSRSRCRRGPRASTSRSATPATPAPTSTCSSTTRPAPSSGSRPTATRRSR